MGCIANAAGRAALAFVLGAGGAKALTYSWKPSTADYVPGAGTPITFTTADNGTALLALPFSFVYDSVAFTNVGVNSNGMLVMGSANASNWNADLYGAISPYNILAPWWDDLIDDATGVVQSFTEGAAPNRVFVVQYGDYPDYYTGSAMQLNWQVRLHEGSNHIQFAYGNKSGSAPSINSSASVGIKGKNALSGFYIDGKTGSRTVPNALLNSNTGFPTAGTVFTFAPDTAAPLGLTAAPGSGRADLSWRRTRLTSLLRYRIWAGTSPTTMTLRDSVAGLTDMTFSLTGLVNGTTYYVGVTVVGQGLEESGFAQVVTVTPTQAPAVSITSPASGSVFPSNGTITFTASASDPDGSIARVEYYRGGTTLIGTATLGTAYALTWSFLTTGTHTITARAYDNLGAMATSAPITVIVNAVPVVSLTGPPTGTVLPPGSDVTLTATASDADGSVAQVEFLSGGVPVGSDATAPYSFTWNAVPAGRYTLTARAVDDRGATTVSTSSILSVTQPPTVAVTSPAAGTLVHSAAGIITLTANATDPDGTVSRVDFYRGATLLGGAFSGNPFTYNAAAVTGTWALTARATDNWGAMDTSEIVTFTVNVSPSVNLTSPLAGTYPVGTVFNLNGSVSDGDGTVALVEFFRDGVKIGEDASSPYGLPWTPDTAGRFGLSIRATDNAGGTTVSATTWITMTYAPPAVSLASPAHFAAFTTGSSISLSASVVSGGRPISSVRFYRDSVLIGAAAGGPPYGITWNNAPAGRYRLQARVFDDRDTAGYSQAVTIFVNDSGKAVLGGRVFVTGHDADAHSNYEFMSAALDYLMFGKAAGTQEALIKKGARIAFLHTTTSALSVPILAYGAPTAINVSQAGWETLAFPTRPYDVLMIGSGGDYISAAGAAALNTHRAKFEDYFNHGGGILAFTEQGLGQAYYNFLPAFGSALQQNIGDQSGVFTATPAGQAIGLTEAIVDRDLTHTEFNNVDTSVFRIFEFYNVDLKPVSFGTNAVIDGNIFVPKDSVVEDPRAFSRDTVFLDTLCIRFESPTPGAILHLTRDGGSPDTSGWTLPNGSLVCIDNSTRFRILARKPGWVNSATKEFLYRRNDQVARPLPDSLPGFFRDRICVRFTSATPDAQIHYTLDGGRPDTSGLSIPNGGPICLDATGVIRVLGRKTGMRDSDTASYVYTRLEKAAMPTLNKPDSTEFGDSLCFRFSAATPGSHIHYTLDGGDPDTAGTHAHDGDSLCVDRSVTVRLMAERPNFLPSDENAYRYFQVTKVATPVPDRADSTWFAETLCVRWTVATSGAVIRVTTDGSPPDSTSRMLSSGDTLCLDRTVTIKAKGMKPDWTSSPDTAATYLRMLRAAKPEPDKADSTYFPDRLCVMYVSATEGVRIRYTLDGGRADTSGLSIANGDTLCVDRSVRIGAVAAHKNWIPSEESVLQVFRMETVAVPQAGVPDSTWFRDSLCVPWTTTTAGAAITVRRTPPVGAETLLVSGDSVCLDHSATLRAVGSLKNWKDSPEAVRHYFRMDTVAKPVFDSRDTLFHPSICVKVSTPTPGADIRYTMDGGDPDTSSLVKRGGDTICTDRSAAIRAIGERKNSVTSGEASLTLTRMPQVASLKSSIGESAVFARRICFTLVSPTDSVRIRYTLDGGDPLDDTLSMANGDSLCLDRSAELVAVGTRPFWRNSETIRISLEADNEGPRLVSAEKRPYDIRNASVTGDCRGIGQDTLVATFSEPLFPKSEPPRWDRLLIYAPSCDSGEGLPVRPFGEPVISDDGLKATILLDNGAPDEKPKLGNCLSLDWNSGEFPDRVGNLPEKHGIRIEGRESPVRISQIRAYPPVVGLDDAGAKGGCIDERVEINTWIPPVGFNIVRGDIDAGEVRNCLERGGEGPGRRTSIPTCLSIVEVVSDGPYIADIGIFDNLGNFIHGSRQGFGACGEMDNLERSVAGKQRSYLVWNTRDRKGARAGNGVYVWRIAFQSEKNGVRGIQTVLLRTGILRTGACGE